MASKFFLVVLLATILVTGSFSQTYATASWSNFSITHEIFHDLSNLGLNVYLGGFIFVAPFDTTVRSVIPKTVMSEFIDRLDVVGFSTLALLTAGIVYPLDPYLSFTILESFSATLVVTALAKFLVGRARPYVEEGALSFHPFSLSPRYQSFPSAHASLSWAIFTPVAERFGALYYALPVIFSIQRLTSDNHWLSDVVAGASFGWWLGASFYRTRYSE